MLSIFKVCLAFSQSVLKVLSMNTEVIQFLLAGYDLEHGNI